MARKRSGSEELSRRGPRALSARLARFVVTSFGQRSFQSEIDDVLRRVATVARVATSTRRAAAAFGETSICVNAIHARAEINIG